MGRWLLGQLARAGLAAWAIASLVFVLSRLAAGPQELLLDLGEAPVLSGPSSAADQQVARQALTQRLGLAEPVFYVTRTSEPAPRWHWHGRHNQYHHWVLGLLHGQLGVSFRDGQPLGPPLRAALAYTLPLTGAAALGAALGSLALALALASGPSAGWRAALHVGLSALQGLPLFALALGLLFLFANPDALNILPASSLADSAAAPSPYLLVLRLVLPGAALLLAVLPELTLPLAAALHQELAAGYATTARAKGLTHWQLLRHHALPNALLPLLTSFTNLLPTLVAGTVVVEVVFAVPGMGRLLAEAAATHDYPLVVAGVLFTAAARLLALTLADVLYVLADPRIRATA